MEHGTGLFTALEQSGIALFVRDSFVLYPLANVGHVLSVLIFFALVAAMDLAVLRALPGADAAAVIGRLRPFAIAAFCGIALTGAFLFLAEAGALVRNTAFQAKVLAIALGLANVALFNRHAQDLASRAARRSAAISMVLWLTAAALGRFIAYA